MNYVINIRGLLVLCRELGEAVSILPIKVQVHNGSAGTREHLTLNIWEKPIPECNRLYVKVSISWA